MRVECSYDLLEGDGRQGSFETNIMADAQAFEGKRNCKNFQMNLRCGGIKNQMLQAL